MLATTAAAVRCFAGGGGKRAEAKRLLAEAAVKRGTAAGGKGKAAAAATAAAAGNSAKPAARSSTAAAAANGEKDWRLVAPARQKLPEFKPGAVTWDTDDYSTAAAAQQLKQQQAAKAAAAGGAAGAAAIAARFNPKQWYDEHHAKYKESAFTTGATARAFTSTIAEAQTKSQRQLQLIERNPSKKGYVRLHTNLGDLNLELHCDLTPRTCENFMYLCEMGYYNDTVFHRSIKNFMIQVSKGSALIAVDSQQCQESVLRGLYVVGRWQAGSAVYSSGAAAAADFKCIRLLPMRLTCTA